MTFRCWLFGHEPGPWFLRQYSDELTKHAICIRCGVQLGGYSPEELA